MDRPSLIRWTINHAVSVAQDDVDQRWSLRQLIPAAASLWWSVLEPSGAQTGLTEETASRSQASSRSKIAIASSLGNLLKSSMARIRDASSLHKQTTLWTPLPGCHSRRASFHPLQGLLVGPQGRQRCLQRCWLKNRRNGCNCKIDDTLKSESKASSTLASR
jgi:hypothetical protein